MAYGFRGRYSQDSQHKHTHQANLTTLVHLQTKENVKGESDGNEVSKDRHAGSRYTERVLIDTVSGDQGVPVDLDRDTLKEDDEEHRHHQSCVEGDGCPDDISNDALDAGEPQQEDQHRLLH